jgi:hypothetical protein
MKHLKKEHPGNGVKCLGDVYLEQQAARALSVQLFARKPDCYEIVLNTSPLDERALVTANEHV